eukprot:TRINITY_DN6261_c0_g1_i1.p1 TRINITY_DN6261_c0_g1~~TRINITY_DN6261_c0_g1_i1.p1  ORF type:complete len:398 (+),score=119.99 TRINITY_DN6261_c0_g1_i1:55-1194(+)
MKFLFAFLSLCLFCAVSAQFPPRPADWTISSSWGPATPFPIDSAALRAYSRNDIAANLQSSYPILYLGNTTTPDWRTISAVSGAYPDYYYSVVQTVPRASLFISISVNFAKEDRVPSGGLSASIQVIDAQSRESSNNQALNIIASVPFSASVRYSLSCIPVSFPVFVFRATPLDASQAGVPFNFTTKYSLTMAANTMPAGSLAYNALAVTPDDIRNYARNFLFAGPDNYYIVTNVSYTLGSVLQLWVGITDPVFTGQIQKVSVITHSSCSGYTIVATMDPSSFVAFPARFQTIGGRYFFVSNVTLLSTYLSGAGQQEVALRFETSSFFSSLEVQLLAAVVQPAPAPAPGPSPSHSTALPSQLFSGVIVTLLLLAGFMFM